MCIEAAIKNLQGPPPCTCHPHSVVPAQTRFAYDHLLLDPLLLDADSKWKQPLVQVQL